MSGSRQLSGKFKIYLLFIVDFGFVCDLNISVSKPMPGHSGNIYCLLHVEASSICDLLMSVSRPMFGHVENNCVITC